jgi:hypothetical protein
MPEEGETLRFQGNAYWGPSLPAILMRLCPLPLFNDQSVFLSSSFRNLRLRGRWSGTGALQPLPAHPAVCHALFSQSCPLLVGHGWRPRAPAHWRRHPGVCLGAGGACCSPQLLRDAGPSPSSLRLGPAVVRSPLSRTC